MAIEKVFAINAAPETIWDALWADLGKGDPGSYAVQGSTWPSRLELDVELGGVRCRLLYRIEKQGGYCEVSAAVTPLSRRYPLYYVLTFGHIKRNYQMLLVTGLANLKAAVEAPASTDGAAAD